MEITVDIYSDIFFDPSGCQNRKLPDKQNFKGHELEY